MGFFEFSINLRIYVKFLWEFLGKKNIYYYVFIDVIRIKYYLFILIRYNFKRRVLNERFFKK